jgi:hypothetical protein
VTAGSHSSLSDRIDRRRFLSGGATVIAGATVAGIQDDTPGDALQNIDLAINRGSFTVVVLRLEG